MLGKRDREEENDDDLSVSKKRQNTGLIVQQAQAPKKAPANRPTLDNWLTSSEQSNNRSSSQVSEKKKSVAKPEVKTK